MKRRTFAVLTAAVTAAGVVPATAALAAPNASNQTVLRGSGVLNPADGAHVGFGKAAPAAARMSLTLQLPLRNQALADRLLAAGTVLTPAQYAAQFAPSPASVARVRAWATSRGLRVTGVSSSAGKVSVEGPVSKVNSALKVNVRAATLEGVRGLAVASDPVVPKDLGLSGVSGLSTLRRAHTLNRSPGSTTAAHARSGRVSPTAAPAGDEACAQYWGEHTYPQASGKKYKTESNYLCGYLPKDLTTMYGVKSVQAKAPAIGLLLWGNEPNMLSQTNTYMKAQGYPLLKSYTAYAELDNAGVEARHPGDCDPYNAGGETSIDVQSSHSIAPNSPIYYYGAKSCYDDDLSSELQKMVDQHKVSTISMSFGYYQDDASALLPADRASWDRALRQAALTGITTFASSGDDGNNAGDTSDGKPHVGYPASSTYTTAVGGTSIGLNRNGTRAVTAGWENQFYVQSSATTVPTKLVPNHPVFGAGGGVSSVSPIPTWQKGVVTGSTTKRVIPDVAALGDPYTGFQIRDTAYTLDKNGKPVSKTEQYDTFGGTSLASPIVAAMTALAKSYNNVKIGNAAPKLYALRGTSALLDVNAPNQAGVFFRSGTYGPELVAFDGKPQNLVSGKGWDNVTGVGEPNGLAFVKAFK